MLQNSWHILAMFCCILSCNNCFVYAQQNSAITLINQSGNATESLMCYSCINSECNGPTLQRVTTCKGACVVVSKGYDVLYAGCYQYVPPSYYSDSSLYRHFLCRTQLCNEQRRECFECHDNSTCAEGRPSMPRVQCPSPTATPQCYKRSTRTGTQRGCLVHALDQQDCSKDSSCRMCRATDYACNLGSK